MIAAMCAGLIFANSYYYSLPVCDMVNSQGIPVHSKGIACRHPEKSATYAKPYYHPNDPAPALKSTIESTDKSTETFTPTLTKPTAETPESTTSLEATASQMQETAAKMNKIAASFKEGPKKEAAEAIADSAQKVAGNAGKLAKVIAINLQTTPDEQVLSTFDEVKSSAAGMSSDADQIKESAASLAEDSEGKAKDATEKMQENAGKMAENLSGLSAALESVSTDDLDLLKAAWSDMRANAAPSNMAENLALMQENAKLLEASALTDADIEAALAELSEGGSIDTAIVNEDGKLDNESSASKSTTWRRLRRASI